MKQRYVYGIIAFTLVTLMGVQGLAESNGPKPVAVTQALQSAQGDLRDAQLKYRETSQRQGLSRDSESKDPDFQGVPQNKDNPVLVEL